MSYRDALAIFEMVVELFAVYFCVSYLFRMHKDRPLYVVVLLGVGMTGLLIATYTPVFDIIGYIFYPFTTLLQIPEAQVTAKALSLSIAEMLLPAPLVARVKSGAISPTLRSSPSRVSAVSPILNPVLVMMGTDIPIKFTDYLVIWVERVILSIILAGALLLIVF